MLRMFSTVAIVFAVVGGFVFGAENSPQHREESAARAETPSKNVSGERLKQLQESLGNSRLDLSKLKRMSWTIGDDHREALVYVPPSKIKNIPLVFAFHGHGGRSEHVARRLAFHEHWPEAVCVYPQGLPTAVPIIDPEGKKAGWQKYIGDQHDRDLQFFDKMLESMVSEYSVDESRVYSAGHSNGGYFTYVLCAARGERLAAVAPIAGLIDHRDFSRQKPIPVFHVAGEKDSIVRFQFQERTIERIRSLNGCDAVGKSIGVWCTEYPSATGTNVVTFIHPGGHEIPDQAGKKITEFFRAQKLKK